MLQNYFKKRKVSENITFMIFIIAFLLPFSLDITTGLIYITSLMAVYDRFKNKSSYPSLKKHNYLFLLWVLLAALSVGKSLRVAESLYNYQVLFSQYLGVYFLGYGYINTKAKLKQLFFCFLGATIFVASYGIFQYMQGISLLERLEWVDVEQFPELKTRVFATLSNPNLLAAYLSMSICIAIGIILDKLKERREKIFVYGSIILGLTCLVLTFSRGAWLALCLVIVILGMLINKRILYVFLVLATIATISMHDVILPRILSAFNPTDTSSALRIAFWESTIAMIVDNPWFGVGWAGYQYAYPEYDFFINDPNVVIYHAHNMYLNMLAEIGVVGGITYLSLFFYLIKILHEKYTVLSQDKGGVLSVISCTFVLLLIGITDYPLFNLQISTIFWLIAGSSLATLTKS